jgi:dihydropteroate synthase
MGILNITPDSFYDGGKYPGMQDALKRAGKMIGEGASIIDIGAVSTRPGAEDVSEEEEIKRLIPVTEAVSREFPDTVISVDTYRSSVAERAADAGAHIINDISGGEFDLKIFATAARLHMPYVLMHMKGTPKTMQVNPHYDNITSEVLDFFHTRIEKLSALGVNDIILDPGFGFGKNLEHNYALLKNLTVLNTFQLPLLAGASRKSMINRVLGTTPESALNGTTVANTIALLNGAKILRVHDVKEAVEAVKIVSVYQKSGGSGSRQRPIRGL